MDQYFCSGCESPLTEYDGDVEVVIDENGEPQVFHAGGCSEHYKFYIATNQEGEIIPFSELEDFLQDL